MKKILILSFYYYPDLCAGSFRCKALVDELAKTGMDLSILTTSPNRYKSFNTESIEFEQSENIKIHRIAVPEHNSGMFDQVCSFFYFYRGARKIASSNKYDLIFATSSRLFTAFLGARISRKQRIPLYLDIRDLFVDTLNSIFPSLLSWLLLPILKVIEKYTFNTAVKINMVSKGFLPYFNKKYKNIDYSCYTNGIDRQFLHSPTDFDKELGNETKKIILYAGNIGEGQGLHKIIPKLAFHLKDRVNFRVIGAGGMIEKLKYEIDSLSLQNVILIPPMSREDLIKEYIMADLLFLHLNSYESFSRVLPSKLFEYGAINKPILAGLFGYSAKFANSELSDCAVFSPTDVEDAIKKFESIKYPSKPRKNFIKKFNRHRIMSKMSEDIVKFVQ